jgi:hypothetical protein
MEKDEARYLAALWRLMEDIFLMLQLSAEEQRTELR